MANKAKGSRVPLGDQLQGELTDFCEAHYGSPQIKIIREAVRSFIGQRIAAEPELKERYENARRKRLGQSDGKIALIKSENGD